MPKLETAGRFRAKVMPSNTYITKAGTGTFQVAVPFEVIDGPCAGQHISAFLPITDNAADRTAETLAEAFGYGGDLQDLYEGRCPFVGAECSITVEAETYNGETRLKVKWINPPGGGFKQPEKGEFDGFMAKFGNRFKAVAGSTLKTLGKPAVIAPPVTAPVGGGAPKPAAVAAATGTEDDLPF